MIMVDNRPNMMLMKHPQDLQQVLLQQQMQKYTGLMKIQGGII
jgi:hypothetical protein